MDQGELQLDRMFHALSDHKRRYMLLELTKEELVVSELAKPFNMSKQAVSKHLKVLELAGLVKKHRNGRVQKCQFNSENFKIVHSVIDKYKKYWEGQFDALESYIDKIKVEEKIDDK